AHSLGAPSDYYFLFLEFFPIFSDAAGIFLFIYFFIFFLPIVWER
uniref:Uncharacterized protein n=1 Tax=Amphimedon queenslandica TaxID=400682 RepID=A0A1X7TFL5_AMPQE